jgi:hypothetical protein
VTGAIAGGVVGGIILLVIIIVVAVCCCKKNQVGGKTTVIVHDQVPIHHGDNHHRDNHHRDSHQRDNSHTGMHVDLTPQMNQPVQMMGPPRMWEGFYEQFGSRHGM